MTYKSLLETGKNKKKELSREETKTLMTCILAEKEKETSIEEFEAQPTSQDMPMGIRILMSRAKASPYKITAFTALFCATLCETPGDAVMWAHALHLIAEKNNGKAGMNELVYEFPWGLPTREALSETWESQKVKGYNWLDTKEAWESKVSETAEQDIEIKL